MTPVGINGPGRAARFGRKDRAMRQLLARNPTLRRLYYHLTSATPYSRLVIEKSRLDPIVAANRNTLSKVERWISDETYEASIFQYGLPEYIRGYIDQPLSNKPSYTDLIVYLAGETVGRLSYLELGPSVGKTFLQVASSVRDADMVAVDIEDINPTLASFFEPTGVQTWETTEASKRQRPGRESSFVMDDRGNNIRYVAGDLFHAATWDRLDGSRFNLVFSDAFHSADALLMEWRNLRDRALLSPDGFTMVWDDLTSKSMRGAFDQIAGEMRSIYGADKVTVSLELFQGWVGVNEFLHPIGIVRYRPSL